MESFGTFGVNHKELVPGVYLSRVDEVGGSKVATIDFRVIRPYREITLSEMELHSVEHMMATELEKLSRDEGGKYLRKLYFGPMGCQTGFYILFEVGVLNEEEIAREVFKTLTRAVSGCLFMEKVPFNSREECGNCKTLATESYEKIRVKKVLWKMMTILEDRENLKFDQYKYL